MSVQEQRGQAWINVLAVSLTIWVGMIAGIWLM